MSRMKDFFSVELQTPDGQPLPSIEYEQQRWFVGEPGQEFVVNVSMVNYTKKDYQVSIKVDGKCPGYSKVYWGRNCNNKGTFEGWLAQSGTSGPAVTRTYKRFKLGSCTPNHGAVTVGNPDDIEAGRITVELHQVVDTGQPKQSTSLKAAIPNTDAANKKLPEGKKWFLAPGLKAEAGSSVALKQSWNNTVLQVVGSLPSLKVRYDSSEALFLRKALNPRFAPHRAILRKSVNPAIRSLAQEPADPDEASSRRNAAAGVKREGAGVKRERDDAEGDDDDEPAVPRSATAAERVDLTEEPVRPMMVGGRQVAPDELAVCDLCESDDEGAAPKWQVKKKQQIKVEL